MFAPHHFLKTKAYPDRHVQLTNCRVGVPDEA
jgi:hypothetical protein